MALISLAEASRITKKGKSTLYRAVAKGLISAEKDADGTTKVETSELIRVFGELTPKKTTNSREPRENTAASLAESRVEIRFLKERLSDLRDERDKWRQQAERASLLLEHEQKTTLWDRLFRRR